MKIIKSIALCTWFALFSSCGNGHPKSTLLFEIQLEGDKNQLQQNESIGISIQNAKEKNIDKVTYSIDGQELHVANNKVMLDIPTLGNKTLKAAIKYEGNLVEVSRNIKVLAPNPPEIFTYEIVNEFAHDNRAYTQGLEFHGDTLYESTGKPGRSSLRKVDYETGKVLRQVDLDKTVFGEGITILDGKIYMLTWQGGSGYVFDLKDLSKLDNFRYGESKEGWGLANDGNKLFKSDGTEKIWFLNPSTLLEEGHIETVTNKSIFNMANELEYVDGKLYANVYQRPSIMIIDAKSGAIEGVVNFGGLDDKITKHEKWNDRENVLNGIAYNRERNTFFVTGKDWDKLFEVKILKK